MGLWQLIRIFAKQPNEGTDIDGICRVTGKRSPEPLLSWGLGSGRSSSSCTASHALEGRQQGSGSTGLHWRNRCNGLLGKVLQASLVC